MEIKSAQQNVLSTFIRNSTGQAVLGAIWLLSMASIYGKAVLPVAGLP
jgi:hypothetical protein